MDHLHLHHHQQQQEFVKGLNGRVLLDDGYNNVNNNSFDDYLMNYHQNVVHHQQQQQVSGGSSGTSNSSLEDDEMMSGNISSSEGAGGEDLRRGPWTVEEDFTLINYIARHGEGRWNSLARCAGLKRTGKSCRLRWLNYLRPDVRRGNITLEEQLLILELHSRWGNRWSKIAQHLPGRTDNEIKNYWRTRVQKHAKQLKCDVNSKQFKDTMRYLWMPRLVERIQAAAASSSSTASSSAAATVNATSSYVNNNQLNYQTTTMMPTTASYSTAASGGFTPENSSTTGGGAASSDSFATQFSPVSDLTDCYNNYAPAANQGGNSISTTTTPPPPPPQEYNYYHGGEPTTALISPTAAFFQGLDMQINGGDYNSNNNVNSWMTMMDGGDFTTDNLWNVEDSLFLQ